MTQERTRRDGAALELPTEPACFEACPDDPKLEAGALGLRLSICGISGTREQPRWYLHGVLRVTRELAGLRPEELFGRIVIVVRGAISESIQARHAFRNEVAFPEDVVNEAETIRAAFHVDLLRLFAFETRTDTHYIEACLGPLVSNTVVCPVEMTWLPAPWQTIDWHTPPSVRP